MGTSRVEELQRKFDENPRRYFAPLANELRKLGDLAQAIAICRAHLPNQPAHVSGHIVLAQALYESGELEDARVAFAAAVELDPENLIALRYMGDIARAGGDREAARTWYQRVLDADPRNYEIARVMRELDGMPNDTASAPSPVESRPVSRAATEENEPPAPPPRSPFAPPSSQEEASPFAPPSEQHEASTSASPESARTTERKRVFPPAESGPAAEESESYDESLESFASPSGREDAAINPSDLDAAWESAPTPTSELSDYEAAPEQLFEEGEDPFAERPGIAEAGEGRVRMKTAEIEALFDPLEAVQTPPPAAAEPQPATSEISAANGADQIAEEVEESFREELSAMSREAWSEQPSLMSLPPLDESERAATTSPWPDRDEVDSVNASASASADRETPTDEPSMSAAPPPATTDLPRASNHTPISRTPVSTEAAPENRTPFATETLAELYMRQGFTDEALSIYRQLLAENPDNESIRNRIALLQASESTSAKRQGAAPPVAGNEQSAQSVRTFFGRLARRVPARAPRTGTQESYSPSSEASRLPSPLFTAPASDSDTRAAATLAAAFNRETPPLASPRSSERDLSLDHLFRDNPPPDAGPVTLDEFYAPPESASRTENGGSSEDDERAADIRQFTSWLEGLKKK